MKDKLKLSVPLLCALTWFGHSCGASLATGRLAAQYCTRHGAYGFIAAVFIWVVTCGFCFIVMDYARLIKANSYHDCVETIYYPNKILGKVLNIIWDITVLVSTIVTSGTCIAGCGSLLQKLFGINYYVGMGIFLVIMLFVFLIGPGILERLGKMSLPMLILLLVLCVVMFTNNIGNMNASIAGTYNDILDPKAVGIGSALNDGLTYGMTQSGFVATGIVYAGRYTKRKETVKSCFLAFIFGAVAMVLTTMSVFAYFPDSQGETLPLLYAMQQYNSTGATILYAIYNIIVLLAYISTAGSIITGATARYKLIVGKVVKSEKACTIILLVFFLCASVILGRFGLTVLVDKGFKLVGKVRTFVWFWPLLVLGPIAIMRVSKKIKETGKIPFGPHAGEDANIN